LFPGHDRTSRRANALKLKYARYDLIQIESIDTYMNCTTHIDGDIESILETVTLPFE